MSQFGSSVRDQEREDEDKRAKLEARQMDIRALSNQVMNLQKQVSDLTLEMGKRDGTIQMLNQRLANLEQDSLSQKMAHIGSGPSKPVTT